MKKERKERESKEEREREGESDGKKEKSPQVTNFFMRRTVDNSLSSLL